ncbi:hypothetical protein SAMN02745165_00234 [Malonomonas rubra DSM 5091]|uniref:Uncharacterized protein n=1 Tax=Malonomonas rubra DSM 5091 TaxID=1122189 RepID=A0A1M6BME8_MALRU|nr:YceH family protein [Malonomonas rubra]SHI49846.1 hypothetical protein SAMN02745165_00234 [Malonomonas rubra DSM 5091]
MDIDISVIEARVLGAFIEKEMTTPDYYPLSPNALTNACNQKSNRNPVMQLEEADVMEAVESLRKKGLAMQSQDAGSRVIKFRHILREKLYLDDHELAILAELLLRGPQTPGELRSRCDRMARFEELTRVEQSVQELIDKEPPMVAKLARQPGRKEHRYAHLLSGPVDEEELNQSGTVVQTTTSSTVSTLEEDVRLLKEELASLKEEFKIFREQFE